MNALLDEMKRMYTKKRKLHELMTKTTNIPVINPIGYELSSVGRWLSNADLWSSRKGWNLLAMICDGIIKALPSVCLTTSYISAEELAMHRIPFLHDGTIYCYREEDTAFTTPFIYFTSNDPEVSPILVARYYVFKLRWWEYGVHLKSQKVWRGK